MRDISLNNWKLGLKIVYPELVEGWLSLIIDDVRTFYAHPALNMLG